MGNPLQILLLELSVPAYKVADKANITRNTIYHLLKDDIPDGTQLKTLRKVAAALGYRVEINFRPEAWHGD